MIYRHICAILALEERNRKKISDKCDKWVMWPEIDIEIGIRWIIEIRSGSKNQNSLNYFHIDVH